MHSHGRCPECDSADTEVVHTEFMMDMIERVRICNACPTQWTVSYANPVVKGVETHE